MKKELKLVSNAYSYIVDDKVKHDSDTEMVVEEKKDQNI